MSDDNTLPFTKNSDGAKILEFRRFKHPHRSLSYEDAKLCQARLLEKGVFMTVRKQPDGLYQLVRRGSNLESV